MGQQDKNLHYKNKSVRLSEETWELLQKHRKSAHQSWNLFLLTLVKKHEKRKKKNY